jgi:23S rRNA (guanosine2251-2'-O)-methyltransferase
MEKRTYKVNVTQLAHQDKVKSKEIIFGTRPIIEALSAEKEIEKILIQRGTTGPQITEIIGLANDFNVPYQIVPVEKLNTITPKNHQGVIAFMSAISYGSLDNIISSCYEQGKLPLLIITDHITDVRNFGALARTAECAGVDAIIIPSKGNAQINSDAVKTSAGALTYIPICREDNLLKTVKYLQDSGISIVGCTEKAVKYIYEADYTKPTAIVMGSEETGISDEILRIADEVVKIPMNGKIGSLNVSVSAGIIVYEAIRQRQFGA